MEKPNNLNDFNNLETIVNEFIDELINNYKYLLQKDKKSASGNLINSLKNNGITVENNELKGNIEIAEYWKYVENGRRPGKFPPPNKIFDWTKQRALPMVKASVKERESFSFLVGRKISKEGIKPGNQFNTALEMTWQKLGEKINAAFGTDIEKYMKNIVLKIIS